MRWGYAMTAKDLRVACSSGGVSGCCEVGVGELFVVEGESGGHGLLSVWRDPVEALVGDFGHEAVATQFGNES